MESMMEDAHPPPPWPGDGSSSSKIIQTVDSSNPNNTSPVRSPEPMNFLKKLLNQDAGGSVADREAEWELEDGDVIIDRNARVPRINFSERAHQLIAENMKQTVVIRLMGRIIGFKSMHFQITRLWKPSGVFHLVELGNNFFMIRFDSNEDYLRTLTQGPWMVFGHYLNVQPWTSDFSPDTSSLSSIVAWIRLPNLPLQLYHSGILKAIGGGIGKVIKVDHNTVSQERGKYARIAVSLDLSKPLLSSIEIEGRVQRVEYEGLPLICFECGIYGHHQANCPKKMDNMAPRTKDSGMEANQGFSSTQLPKQPESGAFGPWMIAARRGKKVFSPENKNSNPPTVQGPKLTAAVSGSRYSALSRETVEEETAKEAFNEYTVEQAGGAAVFGASVEKSGMNPTFKGRKNNNKKGKQVMNNLSNPINVTEIEVGEQGVINKESIPLPHTNPNVGPSNYGGKKSPFTDISNTSNGLDRTKNSTVLITDDEVHWANEVVAPPLTTSPPDKENYTTPFIHGKSKQKQGIVLSKNIHKTIKIKKQGLSLSDRTKQAIVDSFLASSHANLVNVQVSQLEDDKSISSERV